MVFHCEAYSPSVCNPSVSAHNSHRALRAGRDFQGSGKERYVFLSFPHISVDAMGTIGAISRPGRPGQSCACGALNAALADIKSTGLKANCKRPGGEGLQRTSALTTEPLPVPTTKEACLAVRSDGT